MLFMLQGYLNLLIFCSSLLNPAVRASIHRILKQNNMLMFCSYSLNLVVRASINCALDKITRGFLTLVH